MSSNEDLDPERAASFDNCLEWALLDLLDAQEDCGQRHEVDSLDSRVATRDDLQTGSVVRRLPHGTDLSVAENLIRYVCLQSRLSCHSRDRLPKTPRVCIVAAPHPSLAHRRPQHPGRPLWPDLARTR